MADKKPRGYVSRILFADCETTGIAFGSDNPVRRGSESFQAVSWGLIVADAETLKPLDSLYVEIKWNGESTWSKEAERVHGLTLPYLEANGVDEEDAVVEIAGFIMKHWGPTGVVCIGGHNVATFDLFFLKDLLNRFEIPVKFGSKTIDTNAIGFATFGTHNSDDLFEAVGCPPRDPSNHNALVDADNARRAVQVVRALFTQCVDGK